MAWLNKSSVADPSVLRPRGASNCLAGLTFVRTGELVALNDEQFVSYVQLLGGRVTSAVSKKTSYLVKGSDPGQTKQNAAAKCGTKIIDENKFFELIRKNSLKLGVTCKEVDFQNSMMLDEGEKQNNDDSIDVQENDVAEKVKTKKQEEFNYQASDLWILKYKPKTMDEIIGNQSVIQDIVSTLMNTSINQLFVSGAAGIGKSLVFEVFQQQYKDICQTVFLNSDKKRNASFIRNFVRAYASSHRKPVFIFDDADSIEPYGIPEIIKCAKELKQAKFVLISQDTQNKKFTSFKKESLDCQMKRPQKQQIQKYLYNIINTEFQGHLKDTQQIATIAAEKAGGDLRNALNWLYYASADQALTVTSVSQTFDQFDVNQDLYKWNDYFFQARRMRHEHADYLSNIREGFYRENLFFPLVFQSYLAQTNYNVEYDALMAEQLSEMDQIEYQMYYQGEWSSSKYAAGQLQSLSLLMCQDNVKANKFVPFMFPGIVSIDSSCQNFRQNYSEFTSASLPQELDIFTEILQSADQCDDLFYYINPEKFEDIEKQIKWTADKSIVKNVKAVLKSWTDDAELSIKKRKKGKA